jgi:hypothetical protein
VFDCIECVSGSSMLPSKSNAVAFFAEFGDPDYDPFKPPKNMGLQTCVRPTLVVPLSQPAQRVQDPRLPASSSSTSSFVEPVVSELQHKAELKMVEQSLKLIHDIDVSMLQAQLSETNDKFKLAAALLEHAHFSKPAGPIPKTPPDHPPTQSTEQLPSSGNEPAKEDWSQSERGWTHQEEWSENTHSEEQWHWEEWRQDEGWRGEEWLQDRDWNQDDWAESHWHRSTKNTEEAQEPAQQNKRETWRIRGGHSAGVIF